MNKNFSQITFMKKTKNYLTLLSAIFCINGCEDNKSKDTIIFATTPDYPPFEFYQKGVITGFDIELAQEIAKRLNLKCEFLEIPFMSILASLDSNKADAAISTITLNEERLKKYDFSTQYYKETLYLVFNKNDQHFTNQLNQKSTNKQQQTQKNYSQQEDAQPEALTNHTQANQEKQKEDSQKMIELISNKNIACQIGTTMEMWLKENCKQTQIHSVDSNNSAIEMLKSKRVDGVLIDAMQANAFVKNNSELTCIEFSQANNGYAIAFKKDNSLQEKIEKILQDLIKEKFIETLQKKWM